MLTEFHFTLEIGSFRFDFPQQTCITECRNYNDNHTEKSDN